MKHIMDLLKTIIGAIIGIAAIPFGAIVAIFAIYCVFFPVTVPLTILVLLLLLFIT